MPKQDDTPSCPLCLPLRPICSFCRFIQAARQPRPHPKYLRAYISKAPSPLQQRELFESGKSALLSNLARIDACVADFTKAMDARIARAKEYQSFVVGQLAAWKSDFSRDICESIAEVEAAIISENTQELLGKYSFPLLCNTANSLQIFNYIQTNKATKMRKQFTAQFNAVKPPDLPDDNQSFLPAPTPPTEPAHLIPRLKGRQLKYINASTKLVTNSVNLHKKIDVSEASLWVVVDPSRILLCLANPRSTRSIVEMIYPNGEVKACPDSHFSHYRGGLVTWKSAIFAFGGVEDKEGRTAERLSLSLSHWTRLPDMHESHCLFTPVVWQEAIYLCSGRSIEVFNSTEFRMLYLSLPMSNTGCVSVIQGNELVIIGSERSIVLSISRNKEAIPVITTRDGYILHSPIWCISPVLSNHHALVFVTPSEVTVCDVLQKQHSRYCD